MWRAGELTLTFRLGSSVLLSGAVQRPNSAIRQLFPSQRFPPAAPGEANASLADDDDDPLPQPFLITAETLRQLDDTRRPRLMRGSAGGAANGDAAAGGSLRRAIERNTLRRSLQARNRRANPAARQDSLVERIRQLTCDVDDNPPATAASPTEEPRPELEGTSDASADADAADERRTSPQGEEAQHAGPAAPQPASLPMNHVKTSSTSSSGSSSVTSTYKKLSDLFGRRSTDRYDRNSQLQVTCVSHF